AREIVVGADGTHGLIAVHFGHHDVHEHDGQIVGRFKHLDRLAPGGGGQNLHAAALQNAAQGEDVANVVVHHQHAFADQVIVGAVQALEHLLLRRGQIGHDAVEEE